jgi:hypothetical protein
MDAVRLLQTWFKRNAAFMHRTRAESLITAVEGLLRGGTLTLSHVGRALRGSSRTKHKIKRVDRLMGNIHLHRERPRVYRAVAQWLLSNVERPVVLVDWSDCEPGHEWLMLTAALAMGGRAIPIYEEVHRLRVYNSPRTHRRFLKSLQAVLPSGCRPILVTDAGFRGPWFRAVEQLSWDWVGRVRNCIKIYIESNGRWRYTTALYREATARMRYLGQGQLSHRKPYGAQLYLVKVSRRGAGRPLKAHGRSATARRCRKLYKDPWLLATSLPHAPGMAKRVMKLYAKRMQIEETFRDLKDERWGFGFAQARTHTSVRREVLLLIATLATLLLWLVGLAAKAYGWIHHFQANTERRRAVLSVIFLGREVLNHPNYVLEYFELQRSLASLRAQLQLQANPA